VSGFLKKILAESVRLLILFALFSNYSSFEAEMKRLAPEVNEKVAENSKAFTALLAEQVETTANLEDLKSAVAKKIDELTDHSSKIPDILSALDSETIESVLEKL